MNQDLQRWQELNLGYLPRLTIYKITILPISFEGVYVFVCAWEGKGGFKITSLTNWRMGLTFKSSIESIFDRSLGRPNRLVKYYVGRRSGKLPSPKKWEPQPRPISNRRPIVQDLRQNGRSTVWSSEAKLCSACNPHQGDGGALPRPT